MRRSTALRKRYWPLRFRFGAMLAVVLFAAFWFNHYVNTEWKPTLMQLAEYEARAITTKAIQSAVQQTMEENPAQGADLYQITEEYVQMDAVAAARIQTTFVDAVGKALEQIPQQCYEIPFGSLTGNSLLSGYGPKWTVNLQPEGYVQAEWQESAESVAINTTRYSAQLFLWVTVNMILDGRTETLTITETIPFGSLLLQGDTPGTYARVSD